MGGSQNGLHTAHCSRARDKLLAFSTEHLLLLHASPGFLRDVTGNYTASFMVAGGFLVLGTLTMATLPNYFSCTDPPLPQRCLPRSDDHKDSSLEMEEMNSATPRTGATGVWRGFCEEISAKNHLQDSRDSSLLVHRRPCCCSLRRQSEETNAKPPTAPKELVSSPLWHIIGSLQSLFISS